MSIPDVLVKILQQLDSAKQQPDGSWLARCPAHDDRDPSLHVSLNHERILLHCFAGCNVNSICSALGITTADLFLRNGHHHEESSEGSTLKQFALAKRLSEEHLRQCGVYETEWHNKPAVAFPYLDVDGNLQAVRYRTALTGNRFRWQNGAQPKSLLYGAWWLPLWREKGIRRVLLVEGESDCLTLWQASIPAVGVAGADCLSEQNASLLDGFEVVLWREPDAGGRKLLESAVNFFGDRLKVIEPPAGIKDPSDLWLRLCREEEDRQTARRRFKEQINSLANVANVLTEVTDAIYMPSHPSLAESPFAPVDLGTLPEPPPQEWLVQDLIPARFITNVYADSGQGKSYILLHLAHCCLTGEPFCGKPVKAGKVLYLDWELDQDTTARRWYAVCRGAGFPHALQGLLYVRMTLPLSKCFALIQNYVNEHAPVLVVVDSLGKALGVDPRDAEQAIQAYNLLEQLPCAVIVIDHQGKLQTEETYANKTEYGTAYKAHYARSRLQIERIGETPLERNTNDTDTSTGSRVGILIRHKKNNFGALHPDLHLVMTFTNDPEGNLHAVHFESVKTADVEAEALGTRGELLLLLREGDKTLEELEQITGLSRTAISDHIHSLRKAGLVAEKGRRGKAKLWGVPASDGSDGRHNIPVTSVTSPEPAEPVADDSVTSAERHLLLSADDSVTSAERHFPSPSSSDGSDGRYIGDVTSVTSNEPASTTADDSSTSVDELWWYEEVTTDDPS